MLSTIHTRRVAPRTATLGLALLFLVSTSGCGTLLFPERTDQPNSGRLDPNVMILDGIGLLFFILPGLIAFGVDALSGAAYLPNGVKEGEGPFFLDLKTETPAPAPTDG